MKQLFDLINKLISEYPKLTDIHITENENIIVRELGNLHKTTEKAIDISFINEVIDEKKKNIFKTKNSVDFSLSSNSVRLRLHVYKSSDKTCIAIRVLPELKNIEQNDDLSEEIAQIQSGLVIISGPAGSGKSTFLAQILNKINTKYTKHCITIEDPVEYKFTSEKSLIHQREIESDVENFHQGVLDSLREDMNVLVIGEMRDENTMRAALLAAETGHLVLTTLHNKTADEAIGRIVHACRDEKEIRQILASQLRFVISQKLYFHNKKIFTLREILKCTKPVARLIRDGKDQQIKSYIELGNDKMITMKQSAMQIARKTKMNFRETEDLLKFVSL